MIRKKQNIVPVRQGKDFRSSGRNIVVIKIGREHRSTNIRREYNRELNGEVKGKTGIVPPDSPSRKIVKKVTGIWGVFRTDMDLSAVQIISRVKMIFMYHLLRYAGLI